MNIDGLSDTKLLNLRIQVESEMRSRGLSFTVGELGEQLAIDFFNSTSGLSNLMAAPTGAKNVDALSRDGERYSIKTVMKAKKTGTIYPDQKNPEKQLFEYLLLVILSSDYKLVALYQFTWQDFIDARSWDKRMNAWYIPVSQKRLGIGKRLFDIEKSQ